jgi:hypothetical protein
MMLVGGVSRTVKSVNGEVIAGTGMTVKVRDYCALVKGSLLGNQNKEQLDPSELEVVTIGAVSGTKYITMGPKIVRGSDGIDRKDHDRGVFYVRDASPLVGSWEILVAKLTIPPSTTQITDGMIDNSVKKYLKNVDNLEGITPPPPTELVTRGLVSKWSMEQNNNDTGGILDTAFVDMGVGAQPANNGTMIGIGASVPGVVGNAMEFFGDNYILIPDNAGLNTSAFTIEYFIETTSAVGMCVGKKTDASSTGWLVSHKDSWFIGPPVGPVFGIQSSNGWSAVYHPTLALDDGLNHRLSFSYDGRGNISGMSIYVDGLPISVTPYGSAAIGSFSNTEDLSIGAGADGHGAYVGEEDEILYYDVKLTNAEVLQNFNAYA